MKYPRYVHEITRPSLMKARIPGGVRLQVVRVALCLGIAAGAMIVESCGGDKITNTINSPPTGTVTTVTVSLSDASLPIGELGQASLVARDFYQTVIDVGARPLTWSSSNSAVATVSAAGVVSTVGIGTSQIRAAVVEGATTVDGAATLTVTANPDAVQSADISMPGITFSPAEVVVKVNGTVRFIFPKLNHNVLWNTDVVGAPTDIGILSNQTVTRTFPTAGVFAYHCSLHNGMKGTIVVSP